MYPKLSAENSELENKYAFAASILLNALIMQEYEYAYLHRTWFPHINAPIRRIGWLHPCTIHYPRKATS